MENRKRQRLEVSRHGGNQIIALNNSANEISTTTTLLTAGDNTFFLDNGNELSPLSGDVFLTICDENLSEDEPEEFFTIDSETLTAHIKQEQDIGTQTIAALPQMRIVSAQSSPTTQIQQQHEQTTQRSVLTTTPTGTIQLTTNTPSSLLPTSVQLPSGCEIYLVKEYIQTSTSSSTSLSVPSTPGVTSTLTSASSTTNIELIETPKTIKIETKTLEKESLSPQHNVINNSVQHYVLNGKTRVTSAGQVNSGSSTTKQNNILLDAFKKRDDKRRATHNEVERRRRDKINSWIFKLKEMLPTDFSNSTATNNNNHNTNNNNSFHNGDPLKLTNLTTASATNANNQSNCNSANNGTVSNRTPPNDSKSQILIKACEYIKSMQQEIKCLKECVSKNEELRLKNEQLENEIQQLKSERNLNNLQNGNSSSFNLTLSSLNNDNSIFGNGSTVSVGSLNSSGATITSNSSSPISTFAKRELIIRDFVD